MNVISNFIQNILHQGSHKNICGVGCKSFQQILNIPSTHSSTYQWLLLCVWIIFPNNQLKAQKPDSIETLQSVKIKSITTEEKLSPAQTIKIKNGEGLNHFSVADIIRFAAGVQLKDYGGVGGLKTVNIRNMGTQHVGVIYDGIQLGNAQNGQIDLGKFSLDNIEQIEIYNSHSTSLLQPARNFAIASTIVLTSKKHYLPASDKHAFKFLMKTGSFGLVNNSFTWTHKITDSLIASINIESINAHGKYLFRYKMYHNDGRLAYDTSATRRNGDIVAYRTEYTVNKSFKDGWWKTNLYHYISERGLPGYIGNNIFNHTQRQWDQNSFLQTNFQKKYNRYKILLNGKISNDYLRYLDDDTTTLFVDNKYLQQEYYFSLAQEYKLKNYWNIGLSTDYIHNSMQANLVNFSYPKRNTILMAFNTLFNLNKFSFQTGVFANFIYNQVKKNLSPKNIQQLYPSFHIAYTPTFHKNFILRAFYKEVSRNPTFNDLYYTFVGNTQLNPELSKQYSICFTYNKKLNSKIFPAFDITSSFYYNEVKDKIVAIPTSNPFRWTMLNLGFVKIKGVEINSELQLKKGTIQGILKLNYTYQDANDFTNKTDFFYGHQIPYAPKHSMSTTLQTNYKTWQSNISFIYTGERYAQKANIPRNYLPAWYTTDLGLSKKFTLKKHHITTAVELNNVLNQYYDVVLNYPMPGRNFKISASINF